MFGKAIKQFSESLDTLREFTALSASYFSEKQAEEMEQNAEALLPLAAMLKHVDPTRDFLPKDMTTDSTNFEVKPDSDISADGSRGFRIFFQDYATQEAFKHALDKMQRSHKRIRHLYDISLVSIISNTEWYLSRLLHTYFDRYPDAVESKEKSFSLQDLKSFETIAHARTYLIDNTVENILRGSFEDWLSFVKSKLNLSCGYLQHDVEALSEAFQRRNLLIHNGGTVNQIYLAKVSPSFKDKQKLGDRIQVEPVYLDETICRFERCFILIGAELWKKLEPEDRERSDLLITIAFDHLAAERWDIAEGLSFFAMNDAKLPEVDRLIATVNYWQSLKWQGRFHEVQELVRKADFSAKNEAFPLAQAVLLDDFETFFENLPHALDSGALPKGALTQWPLFREVRKIDKAKPFLERDAISSEEAPPSIRDQESA